MISNTVIQNLAKKLQSTELNIRREYIQHLFLSYFYQQLEADNIYFKGGTALRIIHQSPRFSEDLDFSSATTGINKIENILIQTIREIEREGIGTDIKESKKPVEAISGLFTAHYATKKLLFSSKFLKEKEERKEKWLLLPMISYRHIRLSLFLRVNLLQRRFKRF